MQCSDEGVFVELGGERVIREEGDSSVRRGHMCSDSVRALGVLTFAIFSSSSI